jgi:hypothetical protein
MLAAEQVWAQGFRVDGDWPTTARQTDFWIQDLDCCLQVSAPQPTVASLQSVLQLIPAVLAEHVEVFCFG